MFDLIWDRISFGCEIADNIDTDNYNTVNCLLDKNDEFELDSSREPLDPPEMKVMIMQTA